MSNHSLMVDIRFGDIYSVSKDMNAINQMITALRETAKQEGVDIAVKNWSLLKRVDLFTDRDAALGKLYEVLPEDCENDIVRREKFLSALESYRKRLLNKITMFAFSNSYIKELVEKFSKLEKSKEAKLKSLNKSNGSIELPPYYLVDRSSLKSSQVKQWLDKGKFNVKKGKRIRWWSLDMLKSSIFRPFKAERGK